MADSLKDKAASTTEVKKLEEKVKELTESLARLKSAKFVIPTGPQGKSRRGDFCRVILADTHGCFCDKDAVAAALRDIKLLNPAEIVLLGDHLDCAGWLAKHHPFKTVQEARYSFEEDLTAANVFLDSVQKAAPKAKIHYLEGNHEERIQQWCVETTAGHERDARFIFDHFSPVKVMSLEKRGITYYERTERHCGLRARGVLQLGRCCFVHGISHAKHAAQAHVEMMKRNVVFGHVHRRMQFGSTDVETEFDGWCPGCLCHFEPMWKHSQPTNWSHGYGLQLVRAEGSFLHINVPIIEGKSLMVPLTKRISK